jgi:hypothetical protein
MASSTSGAQKRASTPGRGTARRRPAATTADGTGRSATSRSARTAGSTSRAAARTSTTLAERAVLVPVGAGLLAGEDLVSTVRGLASKYSTRTTLERELKRYERRGVTARDRFERQVRRASTRFEREMRQRRSLVERIMRQNRGRLSRELSSVRTDVEIQSGAASARVERLVAGARDLIGS